MYFVIANIIMFIRQVDGTVEMGLLLTALQIERAEVAYFIFSNGTRLRYSYAKLMVKLL